MADYWKSNERKYCDFCKCWIAENKISISLHEGGKRHKENVAKKISEINKKTSKDHKSQVKVEEEMNKMEKNAMAAYLKDIENNADLTSQIINEKLAETNSTLVLKSQAAPKETPVGPSSSSKHKSKWQQGKKEDGSIYYWNLETNETVSVPPAEGFVSISDLNVPVKKHGNFAGKDNKMLKKRKESKSHKSTKNSDTVMNIPDTFVPMGPLPRGDPYGAWKTVEVVSPSDLQLPKQDYVTPAIPLITFEPEKKFKEKQWSSLDTGESNEGIVEFKKRKFNNATKRNVRQRLDDD